MASEREYLEKMPTEQLDALLSQEVFGACKRQEKTRPVLEKN